MCDTFKQIVKTCLGFFGIVTVFSSLCSVELGRGDELQNNISYKTYS